MTRLRKSWLARLADKGPELVIWVAFAGMLASMVLPHCNKQDTFLRECAKVRPLSDCEADARKLFE